MSLRRLHPEGFSRCPRHTNSWHRPSEGCALCRAVASANKRADELAARTAKAAEQARMEAAILNELADDRALMASIRAQKNAHDLIAEAFFRAMGCEPARRLELVR